MRRPDGWAKAGQRGVSLLAVLISIVVVAGGALLGISWYTDHRALVRAQKAEEEAARGIEPSTSYNQTKPAVPSQEGVPRR